MSAEPQRILPPENMDVRSICAAAIRALAAARVRSIPLIFVCHICTLDLRVDRFSANRRRPVYSISAQCDRSPYADLGLTSARSMLRVIERRWIDRGAE